MDPKSRRAGHDRRKGICVETNHAAENCKHEWVPLQCREKMAVEKLDAASRHPARDARQAGEVVKYAMWPGQPEH